ncbi:hypothetical protein V8C42DRAFT_270857 [Trichoderma barbatum]
MYYCPGTGDIKSGLLRSIISRRCGVERCENAAGVCTKLMRPFYLGNHRTLPHLAPSLSTFAPPVNVRLHITQAFAAGVFSGLMIWPAYKSMECVHVQASAYHVLVHTHVNACTSGRRNWMEVTEYTALRSCSPPRGGERHDRASGSRLSSLPHLFGHVRLHPLFPTSNVLVTDETWLGFMIFPRLRTRSPLCSTLPMRRIESLTLNLISWSVASGDTTACSAATCPVGSRTRDFVACKLTAYKAADTEVSLPLRALAEAAPWS